VKDTKNMNTLPTEVRALFEGRNLGHLATVMPDGAPVWVGVEGDRIERLEGDAAWTVIDRVSRRYIGQPYPLRTDRVVFLIEPERASAESFG
jgi:hypothetical protein